MSDDKQRFDDVARGVRAAWRRLGEAVHAFEEDDASFLAGGIAFYAVLSFAPMSVIALVVAAAVLGTDAANGVLTQTLRPAIGMDAARFVADVIERSRASGHGSWATLASTGVTLYAGTRLFACIQTALNRIWGVPRSQKPLLAQARSLLKKRLRALVLVVGLGALLILLVGWRSSAHAVAGHLGFSAVPLLWRAADFVFGLILLTALLAAIYRYLPDARIRWRPALQGGALTALLVSLGSALVASYFDSAGAQSTYGAAGSVVVLMLAMYYIANIFLFGAELTGVIAADSGHHELSPRAQAHQSSRPPRAGSLARDGG